ncbi:MAG: hypothetical protein GWN18_14980 [Thermoplasmata archaeon]|nr:hypothetical protein [Thermoplasmata archaeon]NIS13367.1 hypothetical protein [Thermoplasmata archaeon]NIS21255.1 hypothetical protein [Thermoplasmata archaeon]NIT78754.1 hypothetical protein [Thermoplasmata archaeon]NIU50308.1 hypothetical protein [Thermoplasmata archaeon]
MSFIEKLPRTEKGVIDRLVDRLPDLLDGLEVESLERGPDVATGVAPDLVARVRVGRTSRSIVIKVKARGEPRHAEMAVTALRHLTESLPRAYPVFASGYVSERARRICRREGVGYVDLVGNVYLRFDSVLVDRVSPESRPREERGARQLFAPKATRVVRDLLVNWREPSRITDLADRCDMSPGGVYWVVSLLEDRGYAERDERKRVVLTEPGGLLDAWARKWSMERNGRRPFFSLDRTPEAVMRSVAEAARGTGTRYAFTLMAGASLVAPFVRFEDVWVYVVDEEPGWGRDLGLQPVDGGANLVFLDPYDEGVLLHLQDADGMKVVSDVQLYVDLYNHPGRGREQAEFLRERALEY